MKKRELLIAFVENVKERLGELILIEPALIAI